MHLKSLYLHNFRIYEEALIEFSPDVNWIHGPNAAGKTTVLEAIHLLAGSVSFRTSQMAHLIKHGASHFYLEAQFIKHDVPQRLRFSYSAQERKVFLNNTSCPSLSSISGLLPCVVLSPDDLCLINGGPQERRRLLDGHLSQLDPLYLHHLTRYQRAMRQRNCLLKAKNSLAIEGWEYEMAISAAYLLESRLKLVTRLQELAQPFHRHITNEEAELQLIYKPAGKVGGDQKNCREQYIELYRKNRPREMALAITLIGPHKDDITIGMMAKEARYFASEGQQRSLAAALRLAQWQQLRETGEHSPLMLLDDITTSLDAGRCQRLYESLHSLSQLFLTSTDPIPDSLKEKRHRIIQMSKPQ